MKRDRFSVMPTLSLLCVLLFSGVALAQEGSPKTFQDAAIGIDLRLEASIRELSELRERIAEQKILLSRSLGEYESALNDARAENQKTTRSLDRSTLDLSTARTDIKARRDESNYLANLFDQYYRNFEAGLHVVELQRYGVELESLDTTLSNPDASVGEVFEAQTALLDLSLGRLEGLLGGTRFAGTAVDPAGLVQPGQFVLVGPSALFQASGSDLAGTAEQRLGSVEPAEIAFANLDDAEAAAALISTGEGLFPFDPSLGNAHKFESTEETLLEHVKKGGDIMIPIFAMAGAALIVAIFKWLGLAFIRKPSTKKMNRLLDAVEARDVDGARAAAQAIGGRAGKMLSAGVVHLGEPRELIEEVMYETVLTTRLKLQKHLPFIAICAASAPLLGLLGTVTGIINTFKLITVFGSGDVKTLSGGISEALITTEYGLIVAIPSLLIHAFLSRKARSVVSNMETAAVAFVNQISKTYGYTSREVTGQIDQHSTARVTRESDSPNPAHAMDPELQASLVELGQLRSEAMGVSELNQKIAELDREYKRLAERVGAADDDRSSTGGEGASSES